MLKSEDFGPPARCAFLATNMQRATYVRHGDGGIAIRENFAGGDASWYRGASGPRRADEFIVATQFLKPTSLGVMLMLWLLALHATVLGTQRTLCWTGYSVGGTSDTLRLGVPTAVEIHTEQRSDRTTGQTTVRTMRWFPANALLVLISAYAAAMPIGWWLTRSLSPARRRRDEPVTIMLIVIAACLIVSFLPPVHHWLRPRFRYPDFAVVPAARLSLVAVPAALIVLSVRAWRARRTREARGFAVEPLPPNGLAG